MKFYVSDPALRRVPRAGGRRHAREAAIEKSLSRYLALECGHFCPVEVEEIYRVFGSVDCMCEACGDWKPVVKRKIQSVYPDNPLF